MTFRKAIHIGQGFCYGFACCLCFVTCVFVTQKQVNRPVEKSDVIIQKTAANAALLDSIDNLDSVKNEMLIKIDSLSNDTVVEWFYRYLGQ